MRCAAALLGALLSIATWGRVRAGSAAGAGRRQRHRLEGAVWRADDLAYEDGARFSANLKPEKR